MVKTNENNAYRRGQELLDQGMYKEAIAQFDEAIKEQPQSWKALNSKGFALQKLSKYTEAVECFDKALELNPQSVESDQQQRRDALHARPLQRRHSPV